MKIGIANFYDQSRMINYEASDYEKYADELKHLRDQLGEMETLKQSVTELEKRVREKSPGRIRQLLQDNAASFLTGTFSGLASGALLEFLKGFVPWVQPFCISNRCHSEPQVEICADGVYSQKFFLRIEPECTGPSLRLG